MNIKYAEYFLGIGAPGKAMQRVTKRHGDTCKFVYGFEIDKYARNAFCAIHDVDESKIYHDVTDQPDTLPYVDIVFYSPPCQTYSIAGKQEGSTVEKGNLFYHALQGIIKSGPKFAIMENVANLKNQFEADFNNMLRALEQAGYVNYAQVLNSKDYGIPQNRERIFIVSVRKDIYDKCHRFEFPIKIKLEKLLKDVLQDDVDDKYYLSEKMLSGFIKTNNNLNHGHNFNPHEKHDAKIAKSILANAGNRVDDNFIKEGYVNQNTQASQVFSENGLAPTISAGTHGYANGYVKVNQVGSLNHYGSDRTSGNKDLEQRLEINKNGTSNTLTSVQKDNYVIQQDIRIRKLTPLECFRLQGFDDEDYYKAVAAYDKTWKKGASDSQMYKRAGNSITVNVEEELIENLIYERKQEGNQLTLF